MTVNCLKSVDSQMVNPGFEIQHHGAAAQWVYCLGRSLMLPGGSVCVCLISTCDEILREAGLASERKRESVAEQSVDKKKGEEKFEGC